MTLNAALEHVNVHSEDTFKVSSDNWVGDIYANRVLGSASPQRFYASTLKFKNVKVINNNLSVSSYIGKYNSNTTTFINNAIMIWPKTVIDFEYINLYNLGYRYYGSPTYLQIMGINQY